MNMTCLNHVPKKRTFSLILSLCTFMHLSLWSMAIYITFYFRQSVTSLKVFDNWNHFLNYSFMSNCSKLCLKGSSRLSNFTHLSNDLFMIFFGFWMSKMSSLRTSCKLKIMCDLVLTYYLHLRVRQICFEID